MAGRRRHRPERVLLGRGRAGQARIRAPSRRGGARRHACPGDARFRRRIPPPPPRRDARTRAPRAPHPPPRRPPPAPAHPAPTDPAPAAPTPRGGRSAAPTPAPAPAPAPAPDAPAAAAGAPAGAGAGARELGRLMSEAPAAGTWRALGTSAVVLVEDPAALAGARAAVEAELDAIDRACSRFRDDSELALVNAGAGRRSPSDRCSWRRSRPRFERPREAAARSTPRSARRSAWRATTATSRSSARPRPRRRGAGARCGSRAPRARGDPRRPRAVDRGGAPRRPPGPRRQRQGAAADRAAAAASAATGEGVLVSLGGDIAVCRPAADGGWRVHACEDHAAGPASPGRRSRSAREGWPPRAPRSAAGAPAAGERHHIIDPATGRPAEVVLADGHRGSGVLRRRQHGRDRGDRARSPGAGVAACARPAGTPGRRPRRRAVPGRLAVGGGDLGVDRWPRRRAAVAPCGT